MGRCGWTSCCSCTRRNTSAESRASFGKTWDATLLVGVGGSGRQSLTRIAAFMAGIRGVFDRNHESYTQVEWRDDLKNVLRKAGGEGSPTVFLFNDTQIKMESFSKDINNILNTGEVPNMFAKDETAQVIDMVTPRAVKAGVNAGSRADLFQFFVDEVPQEPAWCCASPGWRRLPRRLHKFPSLVNCCTIDWFSEWPEDALRSVASQFLKDITMDSDAIRDSTLDMCMQFHVDVRHLAEKFLANPPVQVTSLPLRTSSSSAPTEGCSTRSATRFRR